MIVSWFNSARRSLTVSKRKKGNSFTVSEWLDTKDTFTVTWLVSSEAFKRVLRDASGGTSGDTSGGA